MSFSKLKAAEREEDQRSTATDQELSREPDASLGSPFPSVVEASWRWRMDLQRRVLEDYIDTVQRS